MGGIVNTIIYFILSIMISTGTAAVVEDTPAEVVDNYFAELAAGNQQIVQEYSDRKDLKEIQNETTNDISYKIKDARAKGDIAVAKVEITTKDFTGVDKAYTKESYDYVMDHLYDDDIEDKAKLAAECMDIYKEDVAKAAEADKKVSSEIFIGMAKNQDGDWKVIVNDENRKALMGGLQLPKAETEVKTETADKSGKPDLAEVLRADTVDHVIEQEEIPAYSYEQVQSMDMSKPSGVTVEDLKLVTRYKLVGTEEKLYEMEQNYDLNCLLLLGIASHESAYGTSQFHTNNVCGYGYSGFSSINDCLDTVGRVLAKNYLNPAGPYYKGKTIDSVNKTYAADPGWDSKVARKVTYFYKVISENHNRQLEKLK